MTTHYYYLFQSYKYNLEFINSPILFNKYNLLMLNLLFIFLGITIYLH